jgi:hypothetical protein
MSECEQDRTPPDDLLDRAVRALRDGGPPAGPPPELVASTVAAMSQSRVASQSARADERRKRIMRYVRYSSAAAAVALVLLGGLAVVLWQGTPSVALADVVKAAQKHKLVRYQTKETSTDAAGLTGTSEWTVFADLKAPRFRKEMRHEFMDPGDREKSIEEVTVHVVDYRRERQLITNTNPARKDAWLGQIRNANYKPLLEALRVFQQKKGVASAKDTLDGRAAVRFRAKEEIERGTMTTTLWIDVNTKLPIRIDHEIAWKDGGTLNIVDSDFEWDTGLPRAFRNPDEMFSTRPPAGYALKDETGQGQ